MQFGEVLFWDAVWVLVGFSGIVGMYFAIWGLCRGNFGFGEGVPPSFDAMPNQMTAK